MTTLAHRNPVALYAWHAPIAKASLRRYTADAAILEGLRRREKDALAALADKYGSAMVRVAYLHLGDTHAADDASQDALLAAWDGAGRTGDTTPLWPWLLGVLLNVCRKTRRTDARRERRERVVAEQRQALEANEPRGARDDRLDATRAALAQLDEPMRCMVILRYEQGLSVADTAAALGIAEGTVKSRCHAALQQLKLKLLP